MIDEPAAVGVVMCDASEPNEPRNWPGGIQPPESEVPAPVGRCAIPPNRLPSGEMGAVDFEGRDAGKEDCPGRLQSGDLGAGEVRIIVSGHCLNFPKAGGTLP